jgi:hypothetical protein
MKFVQNPTSTASAYVTDTKTVSLQTRSVTISNELNVKRSPDTPGNRKILVRETES